MSEFEGKQIRYKALAMKVLAVALQGGRGDDWAAYVDCVKGDSHKREWPKVAREGTKLSYSVARLYFPEFDVKYKWRY